jgi:hypothetical protein
MMVGLPARVLHFRCVYLAGCVRPGVLPSDRDMHGNAKSPFPLKRTRGLIRDFKRIWGCHDGVLCVIAITITR